MDDIERRRETRRQDALDRLGTNNPRCVICGEDDWRVLELHHMAGRPYDDFVAIMCRNCHRKASDPQKDHPKKIADPPSGPESVGHFLLGLGDFLLLLAEKLRDIGLQLIAQAAAAAQSITGGHD